MTTHEPQLNEGNLGMVRTDGDYDRSCVYVLCIVESQILGILHLEEA
jgi:hypothetical protein